MARDEKLKRRASAADAVAADVAAPKVTEASAGVDTLIGLEDLEGGEREGAGLGGGTAVSFMGRGMGTSLDAGTSYEIKTGGKAQDGSEEGAFKSFQRLEQRLDKSVSVVI